MKVEKYISSEKKIVKRAELNDSWEKDVIKKDQNCKSKRQFEEQDS